MEEINFVRDLAVILISAGIITIIFRALKQPLILGYIIAGFLIGPNMGVFGISSGETVELWSEIGMIFLMFGLGLEFSFKKLLKAGGSALITAGSKFLGCFALGFIVGKAMSWTSMESIFLGGLLSMSSTLVVIKTYDEQGLKSKPFAGIVFGTLVVEDLIAMLLMVLLSTMAVSNTIEGMGMLENILKLAFFLTLWFLVGIYAIPSALKRARKYINNEILLIVSLGLCFGMVFLASAVGFSTALGAFVMGSILSETIEGEHIEKLLSPIKDLFGAIFFISVGMMLAPSVIAEHWFIIIIITLLVIVSHAVFAACGVLMFGKGLKNAVYTGLSLTQLGEFGFIIASVGVSLGVMREFIYPVIITVSVCTIFISPYMLKLAEPIIAILRKHLPQGLIDRIESEGKSSHSAVETSEWKKLIRALLIRMGLYGVILVAMDLCTEKYLFAWVENLLPSLSAGTQTLITLTVAITAMLPFLYGIGVSTSDEMKASIKKITRKNANNGWPILGIIIARSFIAVSIILAVISRHVTLAGWASVAIIIAGLLMTILARFSVRRVTAFESRFLQNLNAKEEIMRKERPVETSVNEKLGAFDVHIEELQLSSDSILAGKKLIDLNLRGTTGANIIKISRGTHNIVVPSGEDILFPNDRILAVGSSAQLEALRKLFDDSVISCVGTYEEPTFGVEQMILDEDSLFIGKTLKELDMRKNGCMVISIFHDGDIITNPTPDFRFTPGDTIWLAGDIQAI